MSNFLYKNINLNNIFSKNGTLTSKTNFYTDMSYSTGGIIGGFTPSQVGKTVGYKINDVDIGATFIPYYVDIDISGTYSVPSGVTGIYAMLIGAGGGGGGGSNAQQNTNQTGGSGGGGGVGQIKYVMKNYSNPITNINVNIGDGGVGVYTIPRNTQGDNGGNGNATTLNDGAETFTANGGGGGKGGHCWDNNSANYSVAGTNANISTDVLPNWPLQSSNIVITSSTNPIYITSFSNAGIQPGNNGQNVTGAASGGSTSYNPIITNTTSTLNPPNYYGAGGYGGKGESTGLNALQYSQPGQRGFVRIFYIF